MKNCVPCVNVSIVARGYEMEVVHFYGLKARKNAQQIHLQALKAGGRKGMYKPLMLANRRSSNRFGDFLPS
jgi:hypothetical protein